MGAGKTTVGKKLARELQRPFVDTDEMIAREYGPIVHIFAERGEAFFRTAEFDAVRSALAGPLAVIALGGGAVTYLPTREALAAGALRVYIDVPVDVLVARIRRSRTLRPMSGTSPSRENMRALLASRLPLYLESDVIVRGPYRSESAFARAIAERLRAG